MLGKAVLTKVHAAGQAGDTGNAGISEPAAAETSHTVAETLHTAAGTDSVVAGGGAKRQRTL